MASVPFFSCFFFNDTATTEIYTLSLHDALPISDEADSRSSRRRPPRDREAEQQDRFGDDHADFDVGRVVGVDAGRSEEHTSELQSLAYLVCRLLLEKKKHITASSLITWCASHVY